MQAGPLGRAVGRLALTLGRRDEAEDHLRAAVALCERMDARAFLAIARYDLGRLLLAEPEGTALLEQARRRRRSSACPAGRGGRKRRWRTWMPRTPADRAAGTLGDRP